MAHAERPPSRIAIDAARASTKVSGRLSLFYRSRPSVSGARLPAANEAPVVVELDHRPTTEDVAQLERAGLRVSLREDGTAVVRDVFVSGWASADVLAKVASQPPVVRISADGSPFGVLPPLDVTAAEVQAPAVWQQRGPAELPVTGAGQVVCVIDVGMDVYHPMFFHADGGFWGWRDVDRNGVFSDGVDTLNDGTVLRSLNSIVFSYQSSILYDSNSGAHIAGIDWIFADRNGNGQRDLGAQAGYGDDALGFGEPLFTSDDVNGNTVVDFGERLVALGTSKVQIYNTGSFIHTRGRDMNEAPRLNTNHGTASTSIVAGGQRGYSRFVGIAPDAELIMVRTSDVGQLFNHTDFCLNRGARVILHEYATWQGFFLDGSSPLERVIGESMQNGVAHINPAGNLAGAKKFYKQPLARGAFLDIALQVPPSYQDEPFGLFGFSLLWRGSVADLEIELTDATGQSMTVPDGPDQQPFHSGLLFVTDRQTSERGTARADIFIFSDAEGSVKLASGRWTVSVRDRTQAGPFELIATVQDDRSRWGVGIHFPEFDNEEHLVGHPGTADASIVVAAYVGHGFDGSTPGTRAPKSGRGTRIDGLALLSVAAPEDPIAAAFFEQHIAPMGPFGGTSGASPHVAGAAALFFQAYPMRNGMDFRDAVRAGALSDFDTGIVPNTDWGYGKLRIHKTLYGVDPPSGSAPVVEIAVTHVDVGERATVQAVVMDADEPAQALTIELDRNYDGVYDDVLAEGKFTVSYDEVGAYFLKVRATDSTGYSGAAIARIQVHAPYVPSGGLACQLSSRPGASRRGASRRGSPAGAISWLALTVLGLARGRRRSNAIG